MDNTTKAKIAGGDWQKFQPTAAAKAAAGAKKK